MRPDHCDDSRNSVTNIGIGAFYECGSLTSATIQGGAIGQYAFSVCLSLTNVTLGTNVTSIGAYAFSDQFGDVGDPLISVTIPNSVTNIGTFAFSDCTSLHQAYFQGNAPTVDGQLGSVDNTLFSDESGTAYYLPGTTGWGATFGGWPTAGWYQPKPTILGSGYGLGVQSNQFGFTVSWATNLSVVVQASTNLSNPVWTSWPPIRSWAARIISAIPIGRIIPDASIASPRRNSPLHRQQPKL